MSEHTPLTEAERRNLPLDEQAYLALVDALGQDEDEAQDALAAVLPFMRKAWDSGYYDGAADEREDPGGRRKTPNPFRLAARTSTATADTGLRERVEALHNKTHWCFDDEGGDCVFEPGTEWWPCPTMAALDATAAPTTDTGARDE